MKNIKNSNTLLILPVFNNAAYVKRIIPILKESPYGDLLIVDRGSSDATMKITERNKWIKYIRHEIDLGYGSALLNGIDYATDFDYEYMIFLNTYSLDIDEDFKEIIENLKYGYDIVSLSRILENYEHKKVPSKYTDIGNNINIALNGVTDFNITDPISGIKGIRVKSLKEMYLTEYDYGIFIQLFIQAAFFKLNIIEIPAVKIHSFGREFDDFEDPEGYFLSIIETEKYLYNKNTREEQ